MKEILLMIMVLFVAAGCRRTDRQGADREEKDSVTEQRRPLRHKYTPYYAVANIYNTHDPDCPLCKELRRQETIAIVDSMLQAREEE